MGFQNIIGQKKVISYLKTSIAKKRVAHAYIFEGPQGIGKADTAIAFAKGLLCKNNKAESCNICSSCLKIDSKNHPDIIVIKPDGKHIKNVQIEEFQQDLLKKPYESSKKIYVIQQADTMTVSAQNRLLKTLEEPPKYALIILITTNANIFLPTIRSRCQICTFYRVGEKEIQEFIQDTYNIGAEEARVFAVFSDGIPKKAIQLKESETFKTQREETLEIIEILLKKEQLQIFRISSFFQDHKDNIEEILDFMLFWFRDIFLLKVTKTDQFLINIDKKEILKKHLDFIDDKKLINIIEQIEKTKKNIKANVNFQLAIEIMLLKIQEV